VGYYLWNIIYLLYFHPLSSFPGPKLWAISDIPGALMNIAGNSGHKNLELHQKYGPIVRLGPNWVDIADPNVWRHFAGFRKGGAGIHEKDERTFGPTRNAIIGATRENHTRYRKKLSGGFSAQAMRQQQSIIMAYVDLLVDQIGKYSVENNAAIDMTAWFNWITFDIIGDLSFGESFHGLSTASYHPWISMLFEALKMIAVGAELQRFPLIQPLLKYVIPERVRRKAKEHYMMTSQKVDQRLELQTTRPDFMDAMTRSTSGEVRKIILP
jgi:cytochrome P450